MADPDNTRRHRFGAIVFGLVAAAALLAVFPATAPLGSVLCFFLVIPAIVAAWRARRAAVPTRRRSVAALVVAPVFFVVGVAVMPHPTVTAAVVDPVPVSVAAGGVSTTAPEPVAVPEPLSVAAAPPTTTVPAPVVVAPAPAAVALAAVPARPAPTAAPKPAPRPAAVKPAPKPVAAKPAPVVGAGCGSTSYVNSSGNCVPRPVAAPSAPPGATAQCKDGTYSFSQHRSGTCSGHGGVSRWL